MDLKFLKEKGANWFDLSSHCAEFCQSSGYSSQLILQSGQTMPSQLNWEYTVLQKNNRSRNTQQLLLRIFHALD